MSITDLLNSLSDEGINKMILMWKLEGGIRNNIRIFIASRTLKKRRK